MNIALSILAGMLLATSASAQTPSAQTPALQPGLRGLSFLVGHWSTPTRGKVAETGGTSSGEVDFTPEAGGAVLLRKDHVSLYDGAGKPTGGFDIIMMIYSEAGTVHADYADGDHVIHYTSATVDPGRAVTFTSAPSPTAPTFRLSYVLARLNVVDIAFAMAVPGGADFHAIATGSATRER